MGQPAGESRDLSSQVTSQTFHYSFARDLLEQGADIRTIQELLCDSDVKTIMGCTHVLTGDHLGYEAPPTCFEEQRDLLRTAYQSMK